MHIWEIDLSLDEIHYRYYNMKIFNLYRIQEIKIFDNVNLKIIQKITQHDSFEKNWSLFFDSYRFIKIAFNNIRRMYTFVINSKYASIVSKFTERKIRVIQEPLEFFFVSTIKFKFPEQFEFMKTSIYYFRESELMINAW